MESGTAARLPLRDARRSRPGAVIATMRPKQWLKNVLVIAAAGAAGAFDHAGTLGRVTAAFAAFCFLASGIYAMNDVRDAEEDRLHPRKRFRPPRAHPRTGRSWSDRDRGAHRVLGQLQTRVPASAARSERSAATCAARSAAPVYDRGAHVITRDHMTFSATGERGV
jgi:hypothetical protein